MKKRCHIFEKIENSKKLSQEDIKTVMNIVRQEMNFMISNNILMTPNNYSRWFEVFCYIIESKKKFNDLEILGLFKEFFEESYDEVIKEKGKVESVPKGFVKKLNSIAESIDKKLLEIIKSMDQYGTNLDAHSENLSKNQKEIDSKNIIQSIEKILKIVQKLKEENRGLTDELKKYHQDVLKLQQELKVAKSESEVDFLTELVNRRRFERALLDLLNDLKTKKYPFSLIMLDIDDFKKVNDTYGHQAGDNVLQEIALILRTFLRANTIPARIGGEELAVILPGTKLEDAKKIAQRLIRVIENRSFHIDDLKVTASFGVNEAKEYDTINSIYERVDKAMYEAKKSGKNRVVAYE